MVVVVVMGGDQADIDLHGDFVGDLMKNLSHEDGEMRGICTLEVSPHGEYSRLC